MTTNVAMPTTLGDWDEDEREMMQFLLLGGSPSGVDDADPIAFAPSPLAQQPQQQHEQQQQQSTPSTKKKKSPSAQKGSKAKLTALERRAKHREVVRRSYHRNKAVLSDLKETVKRLEEQMRALELERVGGGGGGGGNQAAADTDADADALRRQLEALSAQSAQLEGEAAQLQQSLRAHQQFVEVVYTASTSSDGSDDSDNDSDGGAGPASPWRDPALPETSDEDRSPPKRRRGKFYASPRPAFVAPAAPRAPLATELWRELAFRPVTLAQARAFVGETYQGILSFALSGRAVSSGARVLGWEDRRLADGAAVKFSLRKQFAGEDARALMTKTWLCFSDPACADEKFRGLLTLRVLQHVNEDTVVALRDTVGPDGATLFRCVYLLFRVRTRSGFIICSRSIDRECVGARPERARDGRPVRWVSLFGWFVFDQLGYADAASGGFRETGAQVEYGGSVDFGDAALVPALALDTLSVVTRWESFMVQPLFRLPPAQ